MTLRLARPFRTFSSTPNLDKIGTRAIGGSIKAFRNLAAPQNSLEQCTAGAPFLSQSTILVPARDTNLTDQHQTNG
eukprot:2984423-Amphidinium_carterae.2